MNLIRKMQNILLKILYLLMNTPFLFLALVLLKLNASLKKDFRSLMICIANDSTYYDVKLINFLISAEDHRFRYHTGVDPIAILRAIYIYIRYRKYQGASTIEQQFIRTVTCRYERTKRRKFREQLLALLLDFYAKDKDSIARSYINVAFYGLGLIGLDNFLVRKRLNIIELTENEMLSLVSRLKYPEPLTYSDKWNSKILARINYTKARYHKYHLDRAT